MVIEQIAESYPDVAEAADYYAQPIPENIQMMLDAVPRLPRRKLLARNLELHERIQAGSKEAEHEMTLLNLRIVRRIMYGSEGRIQTQNIASTNKLRLIQGAGDLSEEDLWQEGVWGLQRACQTWDPEKGKLITHASNRIRAAMNAALKKHYHGLMAADDISVFSIANQGSVLGFPIEDDLPGSKLRAILEPLPEAEENVDDAIDSIAPAEADQHGVFELTWLLPKTEREILLTRLNPDLSHKIPYAEVALMHDISPSYARRVCERALSRIRPFATS